MLFRHDLQSGEARFHVTSPFFMTKMAGLFYCKWGAMSFMSKK